MKRFVINKNDAGQRVDKFIVKAAPNLPKSLMYKAIRNKDIKLNRKRCEISDRLCEGDVLELYLKDEFFATAPDERDFLKVSADIDVVYEDENILLVNKKQGLVVHEDDENTRDTLINRIKRYLYEKGEYRPEEENSFVPSLCNRIDRNTSGIVIAAKNAESLRILNEKIRERELEKRYLCITVGAPPKKHDTVTVYMKKDSAENMVRVSPKPEKGYLTAITEYTVLEKRGELSLVEVLLHTGRTHQIRALFSYLGCPLLGDGKYGINSVNREYKLKTQALCSYKLKFAFKTDGGVLNYLDGREFSVKNVWFADELFGKDRKSSFSQKKA